MEQIQRQIPKQRRSQESYTAPFPIPALELAELAVEKTLEAIDEAVE